MNDVQAYTLSSQRHAEMIAEAEAWRSVPRHPGASRRWAARVLHELADRISPATAGYDRRPVPCRPTTT
ncbi:hypothetical protein ACQPYK_38865 [Streptosporangium sp. CA-135522]|uniref:hypothetical protein n=1 Tax=Streptosporangium sp. CA-135522 TaxID=3240072 RepID=UPI003D8E19C4